MELQGRVYIAGERVASICDSREKFYHRECPPEKNLCNPRPVRALS
jgi:hypothetical protein